MKESRKEVKRNTGEEGHLAVRLTNLSLVKLEAASIRSVSSSPLRYQLASNVLKHMDMLDLYQNLLCEA